MPKTSTDAVELLQAALAAGHAVVLSLAAPPHVDRVPPLVTTCGLIFGLTQAEARVLVELLEHKHVGREALQAVASRDGTKSRTLGVVICRLRQKLEPHGVAIDTLWGTGFRLTEEARGKIRQLLIAHGADIIDAATPSPGRVNTVA